MRQARITIATLVHATGNTGCSRHSTLSNVCEGRGVLRMMGIRNVCFDVTYRLAISGNGYSPARSSGRSGKVLAMASSSDRPLPQGVYSLDAVPGCRLLHFGEHWNTQIAASREVPSDELSVE